MILLLALLFALPDAGIASGVPNYTEHWFTQPVDHFNILSNDTFKQRYLMTEKYWTQNSSALFFYTGNEGPIDQFWDNSGFVFRAAETYNALVVFGEHRYYGKTLPYGNESFSMEKVHYLNMEQAIADYAVLIQFLRQQYKYRKVVTFGGSYGGQLSTYMRFKYPFIVDGALAASAPIFLVAGLVSGEVFWNGVTMDYNMSNHMCPIRVREAFSKILEYNKQNATGWANISKAFNLCHQINSSDDVDHLIGWIMNGFASLAMSDYPYPTEFLAPLPAYPVNVSCKMILNGSDALSGLAAGVGLFYKGGNQSKCSDIYKEYISCADPTGCGTGNEALAWDYQVCTELYMDSKTNNKTDMFPPHTYNSTSYCHKRWNVEKRPKWIVSEFWGKEISSASNIFFSNGELDPWRQGGVLQSSGTIITYLIQGGAHHLDLRSDNDKDPQSVKEARNRELEWIGKWIS